MMPRFKLPKSLADSKVIKEDFYNCILQLTKPLDVYKAVKIPYSFQKQTVAFLHLPVDTLVHYSSSDPKLRADMAIVMGFSTAISYAKSGWDTTFKYHVGDIVFPRGKFSHKLTVCDSGIHCFLNYDQAKKYAL